MVAVRCEFRRGQSLYGGNHADTENGLYPGRSCGKPLHRSRGGGDKRRGFRACDGGVPADCGDHNLIGCGRERVDRTGSEDDSGLWRRPDFHDKQLCELPSRQNPCRRWTGRRRARDFSSHHLHVRECHGEP